MNTAVKINAEKVFQKSTELNSIKNIMAFFTVSLVGIWVLKLSSTPPPKLKKNKLFNPFLVYALCIGAILAPSHIFEYRATQKVKIASESLDPPNAKTLLGYIENIQALEKLGETQEWCDLGQALNEIENTKIRGVNSDELVDFARDGFRFGIEEYQLVKFRAEHCYKSKAEDHENSRETVITFSKDVLFEQTDIRSEDLLTDLRDKLGVAREKAKPQGSMRFLLSNAIFAMSVAFIIATVSWLRQLGRAPSLSSINRFLRKLMRPLTGFPPIRARERRHLIERPELWSYRFVSLLLGCAVLCSLAILADKLEYAEILTDTHSSTIYWALMFFGSILLLVHLAYQLSTPPLLISVRAHKRWITLGLLLLASLTLISFLSMRFGDNFILTDIILFFYSVLLSYFLITHGLLTFGSNRALQILIILSVWMALFAYETTLAIAMILIVIIPIFALLLYKFHTSQLVAIGAFQAIWIVLLVPLLGVESLVDSLLASNLLADTSTDTDFILYCAVACLWMFFCLNTLCLPFFKILAKWKASPKLA